MRVEPGVMRLATSDRYLESANPKGQLKEKSTMSMMVGLIAPVELQVEVHLVPFPQPTNV